MIVFTGRQLCILKWLLSLLPTITLFTGFYEKHNIDLRSYGKDGPVSFIGLYIAKSEGYLTTLVNVLRIERGWSRRLYRPALVLRHGRRVVALLTT